MIQVIGRALDMLELLAADPYKVKGLGDIADALELNHGTAANILKTLADRKYVEKLDNKKGYKLGRMAYRLAGNRDYKTELIELAKPEMEWLTQTLNENTMLGVLQKNIRVALLRVNGNQDLQAVTAEEKNAYDAASGRLLIAMLDDQELANYVEEYGMPPSGSWIKPSTMKMLQQEVEQIRKQGYATQVSKNKIIGIAVPVYRKDKVVASLTVYMPEVRCTSATQKKILRHLNDSAARISRNLS